MMSIGSPRRRLRRAVALAVALGLTGVAGPVEPGSPRCSLTWTEVLGNFGPGSGWIAFESPVVFSIRDESRPEYQAHLFTSPGDHAQLALVIAEWGDPASPELGRLVYCTVRDGHGEAVEELGTNPLTARSVAWPCEQCA